MHQAELLLGQIEQKYRLELELLEQQTRNTTLLKEIPQALYKQREADEKLRGYENGSLRAFFQKLSGNYDTQLEEYRRESAYAAAALEQLQREQQLVECEISQIQNQLSALSDRETQFTTILQADPLQQCWMKKYEVMAAVSHGKKALFYLEENQKFLLMARDSIRKVVQVDRLQIAYDRDQALEQADRCADEARKQMLEYNLILGNLEDMPVQPGEYFTSPTAYIVGAASEWAWLDRINKALEQISSAQKDLQQSIVLLEETQ